MPRSTINGTAIDLDGKEMILDADQDTTITSDTDDQIDIKVAGSDKVVITSSASTFSGSVGASEVNNTSSLVSGRYNASNRKIGFNANNSNGQGFLAFNSNSVSGSANQTYDVNGVAAKIDYTGDMTFDIAASGTAGNTITYANAMTIDANGDITKPLQCYFFVSNSAEQTNFSSGGSDVAVVFGSEIKDIGSNFASNTFTAPVTGTYFLYVQLRFNNVDTAAAYYNMSIITSNREYRWIEHFNTSGGDYNYFCPQITAIADMDAGDTATVAVLQNGGSAQTDISHDGQRTYFMGYLLG